MTSILPEHFADQVYEASKAAFSDLIRAHPNQDSYAFGLWTDDSLQFLYPAANTEGCQSDAGKLATPPA